MGELTLNDTIYKDVQFSYRGNPMETVVYRVDGSFRTLGLFFLEKDLKKFSLIIQGNNEEVIIFPAVDRESALEIYEEFQRKADEYMSK